MSEIGYHRYEGFDLRTKFSWLLSAPGIEAVGSARQMLGTVGNGFLDSDDVVRNVLGGVGVPWQGRAAEAAGEAMQRAASRAGETGAAGGVGGGAVDGYGQSFEVLRPKIHWEDPGAYGWDDTFWDVTGRQLDSAFGDVFDVQSDYYAAAEENRTLEARADAALYAHEGIARESLTAFPTMEPASALTAGAPPGGGIGTAGAGGAGSVGVAPIPTAGTGPPSLAPDVAGSGTLPPSGAARGGAIPPAVGAIGPHPPTDLAGALVPGGRVTSAISPALGNTRSGLGPMPTGPGGSGLGLPGTSRRDSGLGLPGTGPREGGPGRPGAGPGNHGRPVPQPPTSGTEFGRRFGGQGGANGPGSEGPFGSARPGVTGGQPPSAGPDHAGSGSRPGGSGPPPPEARPQPGRVAAGPTMYGHPPPLGGMGAGSGPLEHKTRYWIPSSEAFEVDVPYTPPVIGGDVDGQR
ncbi:MAG: hypothetical protein ACRDRK_19565 [Pseudonocardia sp.]